MNMNPSFVLSCLLVWASVCAGQEAAPAPSPASDATPTAAGQPAGEAEAAAKPQQTFSGRFTTASLKALVADQSDLLPLPLQLEGERQAALSALDRVDMSAVIGEMADFLTEKFADRFDLTRHVLSAAVPPGQQVEVDLSDVGLTPYRGPAQQIIGFVVHGMTREEYLNTALRALETARQLVESGEPVFDPPPRIVREVKFGGENGPRPELRAGDFALKTQVVELFEHLDRLGDGTLERLEVKHGLPFRMTVEEAANA